MNRVTGQTLVHSPHIMGFKCVPKREVAFHVFVLIWPGPVKGGTMSPLPSFPPQWFTAKLPPGTPAPRPLPPSAFQPPPVPPGLMAQIPVLATVPPAVAAMVVEALRAPPLTTATMPAPPASVLQAGPLPYLPSTPMAAQLYGGGVHGGEVCRVHLCV